MPSLLENDTVVHIAKQHSCEASQVLLSWAVRRRTCVIPKSENERLGAWVEELCGDGYTTGAKCDMGVREDVLGSLVDGATELPGRGYEH